MPASGFGNVLRLVALAMVSAVAASPQPCRAQADSASVARYFAAVLKGDAAAVSSYLKQGTPLDAKNELGLTGLHLAAYQRQEAVVRAILAALPKPPKDAAKDGPLDFGEYLDSISFDTYLEQSQRTGLLDAKTPQGKTALHLAIGALAEEEGTYARIVGAILQSGADPNLADQQGHTPLHKAAQQGLARVVKVLLDGGADPSLQTKDGRSAADLVGNPTVRAMLTQTASQPSQITDLFAPPAQSTGKGAATGDDKRMRIIVIDANGQAREISVEAGGDLSGLNPAGVAPGGLSTMPGLPGGFESAVATEYVLSPQQQKVHQKLGFPDFFNIVFVEDDLGTKVVKTRLEKWVYMRGGKVFAFCDGDCAAIKDCRPPADLPKTVIHYKPTQFVAGMTLSDVRQRFGQDSFKSLSMQQLGLRSEVLRDLMYLTDGTVNLGFHKQRLVVVQAACRALPKP